MICFCYFCKKELFFILAKSHNNPFFVQTKSKKQFLRGFSNFFQSYWIAKQVIKINWIP